MGAVPGVGPSVRHRGNRLVRSRHVPLLCEQGHAVLEVNRPNRQKGKSDPLDAESAARAVLSGQADALPKSGTSAIEMIRQIKVARDTAVKGRTQAMQTMKAIIVSAPAALREQLDRVTGKMELVRRLAALRPGPITSTTASALACDCPALAGA